MNLRTLRRTAAVTVLAGGLVAGLVSPAGAASAPSYAQWQSDVTAVTTPALAYIQQRIDEASSTSNLAIVLDIDNTSTENTTTRTTRARPPRRCSRSPSTRRPRV